MDNERNLRLPIEETVRNVLNDFVNNYDHPSTLCEMATFGAEQWGENHYKIAVHGINADDRSVPHIHVYLQKERNTCSPMFNFEISLLDILTKDEINLIYQKDIEKNILFTNRRDCSWTGYTDIRDGFKKFLFSNSDTPIFGKTRTNLERAIFEWNKETDYSATTNNHINVFRNYIEEHNIIVLPKYQHILNDYTVDL